MNNHDNRETENPDAASPPRLGGPHAAMAAAIILVAASLRLWGIGFGLPDLYHPDEPNKIVASLGVFRSGDLNPHYFLKPGFIVYLNALAHIPYYGASPFDSPTEIPDPVIVSMGVGRSATPGVFLIGRILSAAFSVATVGLVFVAARQLYRRPEAALLAALFLALSPGHVEQAHYITPDSPVVFFAVAAFIAAIGIVRRGRIRDYVWTGLAVGLAAGSKYNGIGCVALGVCAHFLATGPRGWKDRRLWIYLLGAALLAFVCVNPSILLASGEFFEAIRNETEHYATAGHTGMEGGALSWYARYLTTEEGPVILLAACAIVRGWRRQRPITLLTVSFALPYLIVISLIAVRNARTALPALPFLFILAAGTGAEAWNWLRTRLKPGRAALIGTAALAIIGALPLWRSIAIDRRLATPDSRRTAARWIEEHIPRGASIAVESYGAFVDPRRYRVFGVYSIADYPPEEYAQHGFRYLVFGQDMFDRFYRDPARHADRIARYERFFAECPRVAAFNDGGYRILIHQLTPPSQTPMRSPSP